MKRGRDAYDLEQASSILADATIRDDDDKVAKRWNVSVRTIQRYRARMGTDRELAARVAQKVDEAERRWDRIRNRGLTVLVQRMIELSATETDLDKVTNAVKELGELDIGNKFAGLRVGAGDEADVGGVDPGEGSTVRQVASGSPGRSEGEGDPT